MSIAANKVKGIRAAAVSETFSAKMAREHNQAQILCLGSRVVDLDRAAECVEAFLKAKVDQGERHARRVAKLNRLDETGGEA
jgi:ribose 5-phosphate isomerase B